MATLPETLTARNWASIFDDLTRASALGKSLPDWEEMLGSSLRVLHGHNQRLWRLEDEIRRTGIEAENVVKLKREIDRENQLRNDAMERIDEILLQQLAQAGITQNEEAPPYSESPGSIADRFSILSLRIAALSRSDLKDDHTRLSEALAQRQDLIAALDLLLEDIASGRRRFRIGRKLKLYHAG